MVTMNQKHFRSLAMAVCMAALSPSVAFSQAGQPSVDFQTLPRQSFSDQQPQMQSTTTPSNSSARIRRNSPAPSGYQPQDLRSDSRPIARPVTIDPALQRASYESRTRPSRQPLGDRGYDPLPFPASSGDLPSAEPVAANNLGGVRNAFQAMRSDAVPNRGTTATERLDMATESLNSQTSPTDNDSDQELASLGFKSEGVSRELIEKIGYNTLFVLAFGVGFIFVAKAWLKPNANKPPADSTEFEVLSSLKLPGKSNLMLVKVDSERLLVALDPTGVKSVTHLSDSFADKLESYSEISEPFAQSSPQPEPDFHTQLREMQPQREPAVYSRDTLIKKQKQAEPVKKREATANEKAARNTEAIREQMEAALLKFGLKV
jgi:flagellar biogenesis protein FliO